MSIQRINGYYQENDEENEDLHYRRGVMNEYKTDLYRQSTEKGREEVLLLLFVIVCC